MQILTDALATHGHSAYIMAAQAQATGYVWGRQDERGAMDTGPSLEFGKVWGAVLALYRAETISGHGCLSSAYLEWVATGSILVTLSTSDRRGVFAVYCPAEFEPVTMAPVPWADTSAWPYYREPAARRVRDTVNAA